MVCRRLALCNCFLSGSDWAGGRCARPTCQAGRFARPNRRVSIGIRRGHDQKYPGPTKSSAICGAREMKDHLDRMENARYEKCLLPFQEPPGASWRGATTRHYGDFQRTIFVLRRLISARHELHNLISLLLWSYPMVARIKHLIEPRVQGEAGLVISMAHTAAGRMYMDARKFPESSQASGVRN